MTSYITKTPDETIELAKKIGAQLKPGSIILYKGGLGAGKTTFTKGIALALGITETVTSPTFTVVSEYEGSTMPMYHFDLYRLSGSYEFEMLGADDMLFGKGVCLIEWSEHAEEALEDNLDTITVTIEVTTPKERKITIDGL